MKTSQEALLLRGGDASGHRSLENRRPYFIITATEGRGGGRSVNLFSKATTSSFDLIKKRRWDGSMVRWEIVACTGGA